MKQVHPKSQTTQILYQHPPAMVIRPKPSLKQFFHKVFMILALIGIMSGLATSCFYAADKEALAKEEAQSKVRAEVVK